MKFGLCCGLDLATAAADAGFDYIEMSVGGLLMPLADEAAFEAMLDKLRATKLPCPVMNGFVPGDIKITGPAADPARLEQYVRTACARARRARVDGIVFGSGGARNIPDGFDRAAAWKQLVAFCAMTGPIAQAAGVTIAIEPLNRAECNVINSVTEGAKLAREVNHPAIKLLVDCFHWGREKESPQAIIQAGDLLVHTHLATVANRILPGEEEQDFATFFTALKQARYDGRVSIEAQVKNPENLRQALDLLRKIGHCVII
jgi:sugar phosphate isomerase/epimerase